MKSLLKTDLKRFFTHPLFWLIMLLHLIPDLWFYLNLVIDNRNHFSVSDSFFLLLLFVEAALLIENGYKNIVDELWYVYADEDTRRKRLKESRGYWDEKITDIFKNQLDEKTFRENADFVIDNSASLDEMAAQIDIKLGEWEE